MLDLHTNAVIDAPSDNLNRPKHEDKNLHAPEHILDYVGRQIENPAKPQHHIKHNAGIICAFPESQVVPEQVVPRMPVQQIPVIVDVIAEGEDCSYHGNNNPCHKNWIYVVRTPHVGQDAGQ